MLKRSMGFGASLEKERRTIRMLDGEFGMTRSGQPSGFVVFVASSTGIADSACLPDLARSQGELGGRDAIVEASLSIPE
jgi:hypothetical protein